VATQAQPRLIPPGMAPLSAAATANASAAARGATQPLPRALTPPAGAQVQPGLRPTPSVEPRTATTQMASPFGGRSPSLGSGSAVGPSSVDPFDPPTLRDAAASFGKARPSRDTAMWRGGLEPPPRDASAGLDGPEPPLRPPTEASLRRGDMDPLLQRPGGPEPSRRPRDTMPDDRSGTTTRLPSDDALRGGAPTPAPKQRHAPPEPSPRQRRETATGAEPRQRRETAAGAEPLQRAAESAIGARSEAARRLPSDDDPRRGDSDPVAWRDPQAPQRSREATPSGSEPSRRPDDTEASPTAARRRVPSSLPPRTRMTPRTDSPLSHDVKALIAQRLRLLEQNVDHFELLGVPQDASPDTLRRAYFALARQLHPDRLAALGIADDGRHAQRLFAQINAAFAVLSDQDRRDEYVSVLRRGGEAAVRAEQSRAQELAHRILDAEEAFRRGELAVKRDQPQAAVEALELAIQLNPDEADYHALLAWSRFCVAPDKAAVATTTRTALDKAIQRAPSAMTARFYLGRVERMLGRDAEALRHFREVLAAVPNHSDAAAELRVLESRMPAGGGKSGNKR